MADKKMGCMSLMDARRLVGLVIAKDILRYVEGLE
jgi:hypothetical protein